MPSGVRNERAIEYLYVEQTEDPTDLGSARYVSGDFRFVDSVGTFNPRSQWTLDHPGVRHLIHFIDDGPANGFASGAYKEILPAGSPFPTQAVWYESSAKLKKIVELNVTRDTKQKPAFEEWKMYDTDGSTVLVTVTDEITYSGVYELSRTRTIA